MDFSKYQGIPITKLLNRNESALKSNNKEEPPNSIMKVKRQQNETSEDKREDSQDSDKENEIKVLQETIN